MSSAAVEWLAAQGRVPAGGVIVAPPASGTGASPPQPSLVLAEGDHPLPGERSLVAAEHVGEIASRVRTGDLALVLLSGGATSLIAAPVAGITPEDLSSAFERLLGSGLPIGEMNLVRKRLSRWGAGRLAVAVAPAAMLVLVVSDVPGDDAATIGSGPCAPDAASADDVLRLLQRQASLWRGMPEPVRDYLELVARGQLEETPKPGREEFQRVTTRIIANNYVALLAAARRAGELGIQEISVLDEPLAGAAAERGRGIALQLLEVRRTMRRGGSTRGRSTCLIWGGETTVTLGSGSAGLGGRSQELALAAAGALHAAGPVAEGIALLAAGTDGRDGPTDAAGAVVDHSTWRAILAAGRDPERDLLAHDSYHALDAAGALLRIGDTGTNVMDVVVGLVEAG